MDSTDFSPLRQKDKLTTMRDVGNTDEICKTLIVKLKHCLNENNEEMKENCIKVESRNTCRRSLQTRSLRQLSKPNYKDNFMSSDDEEEGKKIVRKKNYDGGSRKSGRLSSINKSYLEISSADDSVLECEEPQEKQTSELEDTKSKSIPISESSPESPKRRNDERNSDGFPLKRLTRRSTCVTSRPVDETSFSEDDATPPKTQLPKQTPRSSRRRGAGDGTKTPATEKVDSCNADEGLRRSARTPRPTTTPKSAKRELPLRTRRSMVAQLALKEEDSNSDDDCVILSKRRRAARRSTRMGSSEEECDFLPRGRRERLPKSSQTPMSKRGKTPSADVVTEELSDGVAGDSTPKKPRTPGRSCKTPKRKSPVKTPRNLKPSMPERSCSIPNTESTLDVIRANLHVSAVPNSLPCREKEFKDIYCFVGGKISDSAGGCMYISGMPGTGKTATVHAVVRQLEQDVADNKLPSFQYIEVNGLRLTEPRQVFVRILQQLTGEKCTPQQAQDILAKKFTSGRGFNKAVLLLVDEVDMLRNRRQDVVYNLFDWPSKAHSRLIVLTIANTMDLPERLLMGRVTSRLGLTRLTFQPYNHKQLQEIVMARLQGSEFFNADAVQLVARKVAAVSGDARRALDICRRATELLSADNEYVSMDVINDALKQMMNSASIKTLKACSRMEKLFLQAVVAETKRTGVEETNFSSVYHQLKSMCNFNGVKVPNVSQSLVIVNRLGSSRILLTEHGKADIMQTIFLNVNSDDIHYAMAKPVAA